jgi:hypothetical protein
LKQNAVVIPSPAKNGAIDHDQPFGYNYYVGYERKWQEYRNILKAYNGEVHKYNMEIKVKVYGAGSREKELGTHRYGSEFSSYIVKNVLIHW